MTDSRSTPPASRPLVVHTGAEWAAGQPADSPPPAPVPVPTPKPMLPSSPRSYVGTEVLKLIVAIMYTAVGVLLWTGGPAARPGDGLTPVFRFIFALLATPSLILDFFRAGLHYLRTG